ncbi:MAG: hypothetical protein R3324_01535 [Halobacteriales archaeon]|nr:hypothetical protein [Halobacteriales archaeon]
MNRGGEPETPLEQFLFDSGLVRYALLSGYLGDREHHLTLAQSEAIMEADFDVQDDPLAHGVFRLIMDDVERRGDAE